LIDDEQKNEKKIRNPAHESQNHHTDERLHFKKRLSAGEKIIGGLEHGSHLFVWPIWPWKKARMYRDLASMLKSGVSLTESIQTMAETQKGNLGKLFKGMQAPVEHGHGIGAAMAMQPERISEGEAALISATELTGTLPESLEGLAKFNSFQVELLKKNIFMIIYPIGMYIIGLFLLNLPMLFCGKQHKFTMTVITGLLFLLLPLILGLFTVSFVPFRRFTPWIKSFAWHIPMVSIPLKHLSISMYAKGMTTGLSAGFGIDRTLEIAEKLSNIPGISNVNNKVNQSIREGESLFTALRSTGMFLTGELSSIKAGEKSGTLDQVFESISTERMSRFSMTAKILIYAILLPFFIGMLGIVAYQVFQGLKQATFGNLDQINKEIIKQGVIKYVK